MSEHYDQNGNLIEEYHICGCLPPAAPDEALRLLVNAAHRMAKWTSVMKGEEGGGYVYAMRQADQAEEDVFRALRPFGVSMTEKAPERLVARGVGE